MAAREHQIIQVLILTIGTICKHDNRCKVNQEGFDKIKQTNPIIKENHLTFNYSKLPDEIKIVSKSAKSLNNYKLIDLINSIRQYLKNPSEKTWSRVLGFYSEIQKHVSKRFQDVNAHTTKQAEQSTQVLKKIVKSIANRDGIALSIPELKKLKEKSPELFLKYTNTFNAMLDAVRTEIQKYLISKHEHLASVTDINKDLMSKNLEPLFHIKKYDDVLVDLNFNLYNVNKSKLACKLPLYRVIVLPNTSYNADTDDQYVFKYQALGASVMQYCFSDNYKKSKTTKKYANVDKLMTELPKMRKIWLSDLKSNNIAKQQFGAACEIVYHTAMRIGTKGNQTNGTPTYGLLTLKVKHVKCNNSTVKFDYIGKAGVHHTHELKEASVAKVICSLVANKKPDDAVFSITPDQLNQYLVSKLHSPVTIHKFRTLKGTKLAYEKLLKDDVCSRLKSDTEKLNYLKQVSLEIGKELGHVSGEKVTGDTALKNYIDPNIIKQYFEKCNLKMSRKFQQLTEEDVYSAIPEYPQWPGYYQAEPAHKTLTYYTKNFI